MEEQAGRTWKQTPLLFHETFRYLRILEGELDEIDSSRKVAYWNVLIVRLGSQRSSKFIHYAYVNRMKVL
jgi:hypothetical protein